nr:DNA-directed RNA polymerase subunit beta [Treponema sp.]
MFAKTRTINRQYIGKDIQTVMDVPNLIGIQTSSYESFLQSERLKKGEKLLNQGLQDVFNSTFPIESPNGDMSLEYEFYELDWANLKFSEIECKQKGVTYSVPLKARINLNFLQTGAILQKDIYMGDIPLMTDRGTFIVNGAERVVVSQIHRSPGVIFCHDKGVYSSRIIPYRGSWLEFEIDQKNEYIYAKIDRKKKILGTIFLRALGYSTREEIIRCFYDVEDVEVKSDNEGKESLFDRVLASAVFIKDENGEEKRLFNAGTRLKAHDVDDLVANNIDKICVIRFDTRANPLNKEEKNNSLDSQMIINCFDREEAKFVKEGSIDNEPTKEDCLAAVYAVLQPGEPMTVESAEKDLTSMFFSERRYDLGRVGRYKLNKKFDYSDDVKDFTLIKDDIINTMKTLIKVYIGDEQIDDIDHLGNRRIRSVGELMTNQLKSAFARMERIAKERMSLKETDTMKPQDLISIKPIVAAIKEFFGSSQLSQFMDQINPLAELTHKRRLNALGPGGLSRDRAGFEVRDVHYSHYGRMCPIETPEGPNIGLIVSLAMYTRINDYGFLEAPYRKVVDGKATNEIEYLSAIDEDKYYIGQIVPGMKEDGTFPTETISCRNRGNYTQRSPKDVQYIDVSPRQVISVSASMIPFLEHDDANRALMGCNMQRQGVPLLFPEPPHVGTGMERKCAYDSGVLVKAKHDGEVIYVSSELIKVKTESGSIDEYPLLKYQRTNNDTCNHQRPTVGVGEKVKVGSVLADGPATFNGEMALGRNILVGFVPWNGYNYEDAVLISQRVVREDWYTSIHIKEFQVEIRETKLGPERITRDIPNTAEKAVANLDAEGIIRIGAKVRSGDILVGKVTPKSETETTPEFNLLRSIFGEKAKEVRDSSLRVPHGIEGVVIDIQQMSRLEGDDLNPGVDKVIKVLIANKRKLREGDKMAGRHGNKGVVARILPIEDMPYLEDGTPLDVCLNPLGVPSRMNIGQIMESELGIAGKYLNQFFEAPVFQSPTQEQIADKLEEAGLPRSCKQIVHSGQTGEPFHNPIFVGVIYFMKLHHLVD